MALLANKEAGRAMYPAQATHSRHPWSARQAPASLQTQALQQPPRAHTLPTPSTASAAATPAVGTTKTLNPLANFEPGPISKPMKQSPPKKSPDLGYYLTCYEKIKEFVEEDGWTLSREEYRELLEWSDSMAESCGQSYSTYFDNFVKTAFKPWPSQLNREEWDRQERREREIQKALRLRYNL